MIPTSQNNINDFTFQKLPSKTYKIKSFLIQFMIKTTLFSVIFYYKLYVNSSYNLYQDKTTDSATPATNSAQKNKVVAAIAAALREKQI